MSRPTQVEQDLARLPQLAARSTGQPATTARLRSAAHGSRLPHGVNLDGIDLQRGREQPALLARLSQCVRVVCEEMPVDVYGDTPELSVEGRETWAGETDWLLATAHWWLTDDWTRQWITTEIDTIRRKLIRRLGHILGRHLCPVCAQQVDCNRMATLVIVECRHCDTVIAMRETLANQTQAC